MLIKSICLKNFLSFGPESEPIPLGPLNVLIGPNGSGKSNLIEAFGVLQRLPKERPIPVRQGGVLSDWFWKGNEKPGTASINVTVDIPVSPAGLQYFLSFMSVSTQLKIISERIQATGVNHIDNEAKLIAKLEHHKVTINSEILSNCEVFEVDSSYDLERSIISQVRDFRHYPIITSIGDAFNEIKNFQDWIFGRSAPARLPQPADMPNDFLEPDCSNLGLVLNDLRHVPEAKTAILENLQVLYEGIKDFDVKVLGNTVQVMLQETGGVMPATRLSDGTLKYLCLLAILCHPKPPPLICIEEPELGLHPDIIGHLAKLLVEASSRTQLVVTTHSEVLVDALTDHPEAIVVCEKHEGSTVMKRLDPEQLALWLKTYRLGSLWSSGEIGGNRW